VDNPNGCPVTSIRKTRITDRMPAGYSSFFSKLNANEAFIFSKQSKNSFIVGLSAQFEEKCADDFPYYDQFDTFLDYWNTTKSCRSDGTLSSDFYKVFDEMTAGGFLETNNIWSSEIEEAVGNSSQVTLGTLELIKFSNKTAECTKAQFLASQLSQYLLSDPLKPTFTKNMLIIAFIFFTLSWAWLVGYYCFGESGTAKNKLMILMFTIELIVVAFLYSQNLNMFLTEDLIVEIGNCVETQLQTTLNSPFGATDSSPFISIMYSCTCFLLIQLICQIIDRNMYVPYYVNAANLNASENSQRWFWH
jgi:hypothetical protein